MPKSIVIDGKTLIVKRLTVGDVREILDGLRNRTDIFDETILEDQCGIADLEQMTGMPAVELYDFYQEDLMKIVDLCKEVNPSFFAARSAYVTIGQIVSKNLTNQSLPA